MTETFFSRGRPGFEGIRGEPRKAGRVAAPVGGIAPFGAELEEF
jgi:hypothetical protein